MTVPTRILLATDFSARSDRALDRAVRLAQTWNAELILANVIVPKVDLTREWFNPPTWRRHYEPVELVKRRLAQDFGDIAQNVRVVIEEGNPVDRISEIAEREGCDLIVTGVARDETLGRRLLGATVERLVRISPVPVLIVKRRVLNAYRNLMITTDFSEASVFALQSACELFPDATKVLLHGYEVPFAVSDTTDNFHEYLQQAEQREVNAFLERSGLDADKVKKVQTKVEHGNPVRLAESYVLSHDTDLTVIASHGRSALYELAIGSIANDLIQTVDSDVLLVRNKQSAP